MVSYTSCAAVAEDSLLKRVSFCLPASMRRRTAMAEPWLVRRFWHLPFSAERKRAKV